VRALRDNVLLKLSGLEDVPIPLDVHVMRATLCSGAIHGRFRGSPERLKNAVRELWRTAAKGLPHPGGRSMIALDALTSRCGVSHDVLHAHSGNDALEKIA
jgi:hypothetical protein